MPRRFLLLVCAGLSWGVRVTAQETPAPTVYSAVVENQIFDPRPSIVYFDLVNLGAKTITAFNARTYCTDPDGVEHFAGGGGQDMIDGSDPMPGAMAKIQADAFGRRITDLENRSQRLKRGAGSTEPDN